MAAGSGSRLCNRRARIGSAIVSPRLSPGAAPKPETVGTGTGNCFAKRGDSSVRDGFHVRETKPTNRAAPKPETSPNCFAKRGTISVRDGLHVREALLQVVEELRLLPPRVGVEPVAHGAACDMVDVFGWVGGFVSGWVGG